MNDSTFDQVARAFIADGPTELADRVLVASLERVHRMPQGRGARLWVPARPFVGFGAATLAVLVVLFGTLVVGPGTGPRALLEDPAAAALIRPVWAVSDDTVATAEVLSGGGPLPYLAGAAFDRFDGRAWSRSTSLTEARRTDEALRPAASDAADLTTRRDIAVTVTPARSTSMILWPGDPLHVDEPVSVDLLGAEGGLAAIRRVPSTVPYTVTAVVPASAADGGPTEARLRAAGTGYPDGLLERYGRAAVPAGVITTPEARALLETIVETGADDPYDLAAATERLLLDPARFTYDVDVRDIDCGPLSVVDCFAVHRRGFCQHFATTMAILLRELDIPARYVEGFLPSDRNPMSHDRVIRASDAHAWVQVFFPAFGWIDFDPTGGGRSILAPLPSGAP